MKDLLEANKVIRAAVDELDKIRNDPEARRQYEAARKQKLDYNSGISAAERRGMQRGIQLVINNMLKEGYTLDQIQKVTGVTKDEIQEITGITETQIKELQEKAKQEEKAEQIGEILKKTLKALREKQNK